METGLGVQLPGWRYPVVCDLPSGRLKFDDPNITPDQETHVAVPVNGGQVIAEKGRGVYDGRDFLTVQFQKIVVPLKAGAIPVPSSQAASSAATAGS